MKLVVFDFCDTLVNFQTSDEFCRFVLRGESKWWYLIIDRIFRKLYIYNFFSKMRNPFLSQKYFLLMGLKGLSKSKLELYGEKFVNEIIQNNFNKVVYNRFLEYLSCENVVVINSGGYDCYLNYFAKKFDVQFVFSTKLSYVNDIFTGKIVGKDCLGHEKVYRMNEVGLLKRNYQSIIVYSDSFTDMPIFNLANQRIVVTKSEIIPSWCKVNFELLKI